MRLPTWFTAVAVALSAALFAGCADDGAVTYGEDEIRSRTLTVAAGDGEGYRDVLEFVAEHDLAPGVQLKIVPAAGDTNARVAAGDLDLAFFEIQPAFLGADDGGPDGLSIVSKVNVAPYALYSSKWTDVDETEDWVNVGIAPDRITGTSLPHGAAVGVPNTTAGLARALYLLQSAGLARLDRPFGGLTVQDLSVSEANVLESTRHLSLRQVDASAHGADAYRNLDAVILDSRSAAAAGLVAGRDALAVEPGPDNPYARVLIAPSRLAGDDRVSALARGLESARVADYLARKYSGAIIAVHSSDPQPAPAG